PARGSQGPRAGAAGRSRPQLPRPEAAPDEPARPAPGRRHAFGQAGLDLRELGGHRRPMDPERRGEELMRAIAAALAAACLAGPALAGPDAQAQGSAQPPDQDFNLLPPEKAPDEATKQRDLELMHDLQRRRTMLRYHQIGGYATLATVTAAVVL